MAEARSALEKSLSMNTAWAGADWCVLAMVDRREGNLVSAAANLKKATQWSLEKKQNNKDLKLLEAEAQALIEGTPQ